MNSIEQIILNNFKTKNHFLINEPLFKEGERINGIYFIKKGNVKITRTAKNNLAMWFANPHEFVGLSSFFSESENYTFSSFAFGGGVDAIFIPLNDFRNLLENYPTFKNNIIQSLCDRINYTIDRVNNMKSQNIKTRFLNAILLLIDNEDKNKSKIKINYSIHELSELTGASKQYVKKLITEFEGKNLLKISDNSLVINMNEFK
ncbi:MAG: hypothetical protein COX70_06995 [Flavobacteriales bacterium CG_4_10_14_0_2_um_filter_32_8]|nr:MAG: hypothetical protein COX70_06995 [Flavobacteriales bacterium CG_4_10_14_0_2_um_filter_32_8]PJB14194.1 MAG: hypothetical protein CO118_09870 [Flavobacteriales bacterium CG_4_9_14_3_um_filter_32_8]